MKISHRPQKKPEAITLRERVDIRGQIRPMEPVQEIPVLRTPPGQIGLLKEAPVRRWLLGQQMWDEQFKDRPKKILKKRKKLEEEAEHLIRRVTRQGLVVNTEGDDARASHEEVRGEGGGEQGEARPKVEPQGRKMSGRSASTTIGDIDENLRFGPLDLDDENPPPSAIAKRRDTVSRTIVSTGFLVDLNPTKPEALALLKKCVYHTAPVTHNTVPKRKTMEVIKATLDPTDNPANPPPQSASEQQVRANIIPMHGLRIWSTLVGYMARKKAKVRARLLVPTDGEGPPGVVSGGETTPTF